MSGGDGRRVRRRVRGRGSLITQLPRTIAQDLHVVLALHAWRARVSLCVNYVHFSLREASLANEFSNELLVTAICLLEWAPHALATSPPPPLYSLLNNFTLSVLLKVPSKVLKFIFCGGDEDNLCFPDLNFF